MLLVVVIPIFGSEPLTGAKGFIVKVEAAESEQEKRTIIAQAGMLLTDDELAEVSGGGDKDLTVETSGELEVFKARRGAAGRPL